MDNYLLKSNRFTNITFTFLGLIYLICWSIIIASLDTYDMKYHQFHPIYVFPMMNVILNATTQFILISKGINISYYNKIIYSLILSIILMSLLPVILLNVNGLLGFSFCSILLIIQGLANAVLQNSIIGIAGFLPFQYLVAISYGIGSSGIFSNLLRYMVFFLYGTHRSHKTIITSTYMFYGIAVIFLLFALILTLILFKNEWFIYNIYKGGNKTEFTREKYEEIKIKYFSDSMYEMAEIQENIKDIKDTLPKMNSFQTFKYFFRKAYNIYYLVNVHFITQFIIFPGILFELPFL